MVTRRSRLSALVVATTLTIAAGVAQAQWMTTTSPLPNATVGVPYAFQFAASGGVAPYSWGVDPQTPITPASFLLPDVVSVLPPGLSFSPAGLLQGTPGASGDFRFWVDEEDSTGAGSIGLFALHVRPSAAWGYSRWVPVASHTGGYRGSEWRTDIAMLNAGASPANVEIDFHGDGGVVTRTASVAAGAQLIVPDIVGQLGTTGSGAVEVLSDQRLEVTSRTYNQLPPSDPCFPGGTEGQGYPSLNPADGLAAGRSAHLVGLAENASTRSNIGLVNTGPAEATALVELFDGSGNRLTDYPVALASGQWSQEPRPFRIRAGKTSTDSGYATVTVQSGFGVFAFASVTDNITNDPTTVSPPLFTGYPNDWVPTTSHTSGLNGSEWRTDIGILNPGDSATDVNISFRRAGEWESTAASVPAHAQLMVADVLALLGVTGSTAVEVDGRSEAVEVASRTYTEIASDASCLAGGTLGQEYTAFDPQNVVTDTEAAYLPGLVENAGFHSNIGLGMAPGRGPFPDSATVLVELFDGSGNKLTDYTVTLGIGDWAQETQPFLKKAGQTAMDSGYAKITVQSGQGVYAFASVVDNVTNDPTTVTAQH